MGRCNAQIEDVLPGGWQGGLPPNDRSRLRVERDTGLKIGHKYPEPTHMLAKTPKEPHRQPQRTMSNKILSGQRLKFVLWKFLLFNSSVDGQGVKWGDVMLKSKMSCQVDDKAAYRQTTAAGSGLNVILAWK